MGHFALQEQPTWESITLARFLRQLPPGIELIHDAGDRPLRWVEPSDMDDPTDYLMDHELLLTSGFPLLEHAEDPAWVDDFISRLASANASALGFGLEPYFTAIPDTVRAACQRHDLNLLQIPATVPFAAVGIAFAQLMEADGAAQLRSNAEANRALMRCIAQPNPEERLATTLSQRLKASIRLTGSTGQLRFEAAGAGIAPLPPDAESQLVDQAVQNTGQQPFALHHHDSRTHLAFPIRAALPSGRQAPLLGVLSVGFAHTPSAFDHQLIATALGLLELLARERAAGSAAATELATSLLMRSRAPLDAGALALLARCLGSKGSQPLRAALIAPRDTQSATATGFHLAHLHALLDTHLVISEDDHFVALTRAEPTQNLFEHLSSAGYLAGFSRAAAVDPHLGEILGELHAQALSLLPQILERQQSLDAQALPRTFTSLLPAQAGEQLAKELLAPLLELPKPRRDLYLAVLRGWLEANGSWDQASKNIDLHRNSVRRHIAAIGETLNTDLNQAAVRHELYLALNFLAGN